MAAKSPEAKARAVERTRRWRERNPERYRENQRQYRAANRERLSEYNRERYLQRREELLARAVKRREANPDRRDEGRRYRALHGDRIRASQRAWRATNASWVREQNRLRRGIGEPLSVEYEEALRADPCAYCGARAANELDHIEPISRGGTHGWENVTAACRSCNARKHARPLLVHLLAGGVGG